MEPITVNVARTVRPGCEPQFEAALREFLKNSLETPGQLGVHVFRPAEGDAKREYRILRRFSDQGARDTFYDSALFQDWLRNVEPLSTGEPHYEELSGLETWFTLPGQRSIVPPPRWKMALVTFAAVYPASLLVPAVFRPLNGNWPLALRVFLNAGGIVILLTWLVMPLLTRFVRRWLYVT
jgi:antibiotic biosynthesis monooxygenase (ABM) superfamily enzyme